MRFDATAAFLSAVVGTAVATESGRESTSETATAPAASASSSGALHCCGALEAAGLGTQYPGDEAYEARIESYWSVAAQLRPWCLIQPQNAAEVSRAVTALTEANKTQECQFAVRSGGHTVWPGANNIENGITIDLGLMNTTTNFGNGTAGVGAGSRWGSVYEALAKDNLLVAGGRASSVGVGGFLLGGGNSFFSPRKGMACDNVAQYELVLGSGEIIYVNSESYPDLFPAMKGSSNNFGIVTRFDLVTFEDEKLWGGVVAYPLDTANQQLEFLENFTNKMSEDPYASIIVILNYVSTIGQVVVANAYEYTKAIEPATPPPIFEEFLSIPGNISDSMRVTNISDLVEELEQPAGYRDAFMTITFQNDASIMHKAVELFNAMVAKLNPDGGDWLTLTMFQPLPALFAERSVARGGNMLGLDQSPENHILFMCYCGWKGAERDAAFEDAERELITSLKAFAASKGKDHPYVYLPYAYKDQKPLEGYPAVNIEKIRAAAKKYDPEGVFQTMVPGGFKITKVETPAREGEDAKAEEARADRDEL
ncbi:putative fad binding domain containing protein [Neofusicoccum parvum UCRNP2]|uniref:Putative fad binding domain containing protein n=1 Tax=Botryosphaeria parva (strain UCR-NP2) TaxID=1287680 RepID=R1E740_BOTPV|nr:putative fad binding domain containing protein [Neofusicoccum parvum UCRNP2]